jgi:hypothetical protein
MIALFESLRKVESVVLGDSDWDAKGESLVGITIHMYVTLIFLLSLLVLYLLFY